MNEEQKKQFLKECADDGWQILQYMADSIHDTSSDFMPDDKWPIIVNDSDSTRPTEPARVVLV